MANQNENPSLEQVLRDAVFGVISDIHVAFPAQVVADMVSGKVNIQPVLKKKWKADAEPIMLPIIQNVPVQFQRAGKAVISFPVKKGATGLAICSERSMEAWLSQGGIVDPKDPRKFSLSDAVFLPGLYPFNDPPTVIPNKLLVTFNNGRLTLTEDGKVALGNAGGDELLQLSSDFMQLVIDHIHGTVVGPTDPPFTASDMTDIKNKLDAIKGTLT